MTVVDPVCGMRLDASLAVARTDYAGASYHFCSTRCEAQFVTDPLRFVGPEPPVIAAEAGVRVAGPSYRLKHGRRCPYCGEETTVVAGLGPGVGRLEMGEIEVIMRGEWRRRLGPDCYGHRHSPRLVRSLLASALDPQDASAKSAARRLLAEEIARLRTQSVGSEAVWQEMTELSHAAWDVLSRSSASLDTIVALMQQIDGQLFGALEEECRAQARAGPDGSRQRRA